MRPCRDVVGYQVSEGHAVFIFRAMKVPVMVFWVMRPCRDMVGYQRFGGPCCLHHRGEDEDHIVVFWVVTSYSDEVEYERFGGPCCLRVQGEDEGSSLDLLGFYIV
jgi:hypothetical protein